MSRAPVFERSMGESDSVMWTIERDPVLRAPIVAVSLLDRAPDFDRLAATLCSASEAIPRLAQRVVDPPLRLGRPRWVDTGPPELAYHLRHVEAPAPHTFRSVLDLAAATGMTPFDPERPLWEFTVVEGVLGGRAALIKKVHHSLTDGVGGVRLALMLFDDRRQGSRHDTPPSADSLRGPRRRQWRIPGPLDVARTTWSLGRLVRPTGGRLSPLFHGNSLDWRFHAFDVPIAVLREAAHAVRGTVNDAFVGSVVGGMARYHDELGAPVEYLRIMVPVSYRDEDDPLGGNRFAPVRFTVPVAERDPLDRIRIVGELTHRWVTEPALPWTDRIAGAFDRLPRPVTTRIFGALLKTVDFVATDIVGFPAPVYVAGARILREYAFAPPSGAAVNVSLLSHVEHACIGVTVDAGAVPDDDVLVACLRGSFEELPALHGRLHDRKKASA